MLTNYFGCMLMVITLSAAAVSCQPVAPASPTTDAALPDVSFSAGPFAAWPLTLTAVVPAAGPKAGGNTLSISGTGFLPGAQVFINGVEAPSAATIWSGSRLTVTAPSHPGDWSQVPIEIRNPDGNTARRDDLYTYHASSVTMSLAAGVFPSSLYPDVRGEQMALRDLNGDRLLDIAFTTPGGKMEVLLGDGMGGLGTPTQQDLQRAIFDATAADFNGDGYLDLVAVSNKMVEIAFGNSQGGTAAPVAVCAIPAAGTSSTWVRTADLNRDGYMDVLSIYYDNNYSYIYTFLGDGMGGLKNSGTVQIQGTYCNFSVADLNLDAKPDIGMICESPVDGLFILVGDGMGGFSMVMPTPSPIPNGEYVQYRSPIIGDINGDNRPDLLVVGLSPGGSRSSDLHVFLGDGRGAVTGAASFRLGPCLAVGDFDGDRNLEVAALDPFEGAVTIHKYNSLGGFGVLSRFFVHNKFALSSTSLSGIAAGDFNNDGRLDLIVEYPERGLLSVHPGDGSGRFQSGFTETAGTLGATTPGMIIATAAADFNADGNQDVALLTSGSNEVKLLYGDGLGGLQPGIPIAVGAQPQFLSAGDLDEDGRADLVLVNSATRRLDILLNKGGATGFRSAYSVPYTGQATMLTLADSNSDHRLDVLLASKSTSNLGAVMILNGPGSLGNPVNLSLSGVPIYVSAADCDRDRYNDLIVVYENTTVSVFHGSSNGKYDSSISVNPLFKTTPSIQSGDFNLDGNPDLLFLGNVGPGVDSILAVLLGDGRGSYTTRQVSVPFSKSSTSSTWVVGDFDGDRRLDLAIDSGYELALLSGDGLGGFKRVLTSSDPGRPSLVTDFNGDNKPDIASLGGGMRIRINRSR